jgi:pyrroloquinoline quinone biosynthesis protein D
MTSDPKGPAAAGSVGSGPAAGGGQVAQEAATAAPLPWERTSRPRLPSKVRLQWDDARNQAMLLFPEGVLMLNQTANAVLELVDGKRSVADIVAELARRFDAGSVPATEAEAVDLSMDPGTDAGEHERVAPAPAGAGQAEREAQIERDVVAFLTGLEERAWLVREPA